MLEDGSEYGPRGTVEFSEVVVDPGRQALAIGGVERRGENRRARDGRREAQHDVLDRVAARLRVDAAARHFGGEGGAHVVIETLVAARGAAGDAGLRYAREIGRAHV